MAHFQPATPLADRDSTPWWRALAGHQLLLQRCEDCRRLRWPARSMCNDCGSTRESWVESSGTGTVVSWNVTWQTPLRDAETPYVVMLVRLDDQEDILMPGGYDGPPDGSGLAIDDPVTAVYYDLVVPGDGGPETLLCWRLTDKDSQS